MRLLGIILLLPLLFSCSEAEPIKIGFIGGLSGRVADLGLAGRNGAMLAIEEINRSGGIDGRQLDLLLADDQQDPVTARQQIKQLLASNVVAIVGPMTSAMAVATIEQLNNSSILMLSPTATTEELTGIDDNFLRVASGNDSYSAALAKHLAEKRAIKKVVALYDTRNRAYSESWLQGFEKSFTALGGQILQAIPFESGPQTSFSQLTSALDLKEAAAVVSIASAMDTAMLAQQLRKTGYPATIAGCSWSATEQLIDMGGEAVEGVIVSQYFDRESRLPKYQAFRKNYLERFKKEPGFASVAAYDAIKVLEKALQRSGKQELKKTILEIADFDGLQAPIHFDRFGDTRRPVFISTVKDGKFIALE